MKNGVKKAVRMAAKATPPAVGFRIGAFFAVLVCMGIFGFGLFCWLNARDAGNGIGSAAGTAAGKAVGSFEGVTKGLSQGSSAGAADGLDADDTAVTLREIKSTGRLQVLVADIKMDMFHIIGKDGEIVDDVKKLRAENTKDANFVALYLQDAHVVFTVDLNGAEIEENNSGIRVKLPQPEVEVIPDGEPRQKAQWQKGNFTGSAEKGQEALLNSLKKVDEEAVKELENYDGLMEQAKASAKTQVRALTESVRDGKGSVEVVFEE